MIRLSDISTLPPEGAERKDFKERTDKYVERIGELNEVLKAEKKHALLVILQGMDGSGKDGAVKNVFKDCTHLNINVEMFKKPTEAEMAHDFLWRVHQKVPAKGDINIFNRSHYEDILIQWVKKWIDEDRVKQRMAAINAFEKLLVFDNSTTVLKFYLHLSFEQQAVELQQRMDEPEKNWKHSPGDWEERNLWPEYMRAYEDAIHQSEIPWTIVPVDKRWYRDYVISKKVCEALEAMDLKYPLLPKA